MTNKNKLILVLLGVLVFAVVISLIGPSEKKASATDNNTPEQVTLSAADAQALQETLGLTADTPDNTLRTLAISLNAQKEENAALKARLDAQEAAQQLQAKSTANALQEKMSAGLTELQDKVNQQLVELDARTHAIGITPPVVNHDASLDEQLGIGGGSYTKPAVPVGTDGLIWVDPIDASVDKKGVFSTPRMKVEVQTNLARQARLEALKKEKLFEETATPIYTLVRGSVLSDATSLTALIGRIPVNGKVTSPYPFSLVIGKENLMANGFMLPDVKGAIATGTVTGDWNLSCVRGAVETLDLIMDDGSVISIPDTDETTQSDYDGDSVITSMQLGFLADPNGNPCLNGVKITNAPSYLTMMGVLDGVSAAASAAAAAQTTTSVSDTGSGTSSVTGDASKYALANAAAGSVENVNSWIKERMASTFDAIYTPPGTAISVHLSRTLKIDKPVDARQVRYPTHTQGGTYALD
ncbi:integrating conjugative element protein [Shewanella sairae]|uniref:Integrating conjugative element protein n=1 Tax=Shewanella sairae TaxID=190310 RepID=A0ABQ4P5U5_9GAMM|nr:TIGR03752 family integrating conjugative element protein [Shewanella sairae]MCL1130468.1 TIGR03752 family integrating conjugative element protein [Shewanella sairae]GIU42842.1 integrating conjugative element protein [Shewanella sairae]